MGPECIPVELQWLPPLMLVLLVFRLGPVVRYPVANALFRFHFHSWVTVWLGLLCSCLFFPSPSSLSLSRFPWLQDHSAILMLPQRSQSTAALSPSLPPSLYLLHQPVTLLGFVLFNAALSDKPRKRRSERIATQIESKLRRRLIRQRYSWGM